MSIIVSGIRLPYEAESSEAIRLALKRLKLKKSCGIHAAIHKISFDLRRGQLHKICAVEICGVENEQRLADRLQAPDVRCRAEAVMPRPTGKKKLTGPPVVIGFGPAGIFAALVLACNGYRPVVLERGQAVENRDRDVASFFETGVLNTASNIQFGEGGAGTYSDGKLTTRINDSRCGLVLQQLVQYGAPPEMLTMAKPHIGTDLLKQVVVAMRKGIEAMGGTVRFGACVDGIGIEGDCLRSISAGGDAIGCDTAVLAIGHSARDSFSMLHSRGVYLESKPFSVGVRVEHLQEEIDRALYGKYTGLPGLPPGEYTLSRRDNDRACYSFCMCPGGHVVAAASEEGGVVTNGMSYHARDGRNANAAICVSVGPQDFPGQDPLAGVRFQRKLEQAAFAAGGGAYRAPAQRFGDFKAGIISEKWGHVVPTYSRGVTPADLNKVLPPYVCEMLKSSIPYFGTKLHGFDMDDALLTGVETRTSSPVRITRGDDLESIAVRGLIPCGEGAGYAGGIMSAAVDGIRAAEKIMAEYAPLEE